MYIEKLIAASSLACLLLVGCASSKTQKISGKWELASINGKQIDSTYKGNVPFINIDSKSGKLYGYDGCNNIGGEIIVNKHNNVMFDKMLSTKKYCQGTEQTDAMGMIIGTAVKYDIVSSKDGEVKLVLLNDKKDEVASFNLAKE